MEDHREPAGVDRVRLQILIHMNALNHFIVNVPKTHEDTIKLGDTEIFLESKFNEFDHRISHGEIVSVPMRYDTGAKPGDTLIFHHHVTMNKALSLGDSNHVAMYDEENTNSASASHTDARTLGICTCCVTGCSLNRLNPIRRY